MPRGWLPAWLERHYPGAYYSQIKYTSVAGKLVRGDRHGTPRERFAYRFYHALAGYDLAWGDGLIPVVSALLPGSSQIVLEGVSHYAGFGGPWYGEKEIMPLWWNAAFNSPPVG